MKKFAYILIVIIVGGLLALYVIRTINARIDRSNYWVSPDMTNRVVTLFDDLGKTNDELCFGGETSAVAAGSTGFGSATQFALKDRDGMLGIHTLRDRGGVVIRFSFTRSKFSSPFYEKELSASLSDDERLRQSFNSLLIRLETIDPSSYHWLVRITTSN
jgi:hypothetical protein